MFKLEDVLHMKDGEEIKNIVRHHGLMLVPGLFFAFLLIVAPFFFLFPLFALGLFGVAIFLVAVIAGIIVAIRTFLLWDADVFIITSIRIVDVDQRGIFTRIVSEASIPSIQDVSWRRSGLIQTVLKIGALRVTQNGTRGAIEVRNVANPERVCDEINDLRHQTTSKRPDMDPERREKLKQISDLLAGFSLEELGRISSVLKARERTVATDAFLKQDGLKKS